MNKQPKKNWSFQNGKATLETTCLAYVQAIIAVLEMHNYSLDDEARHCHGATDFLFEVSYHKTITLKIQGDISALKTYLHNNQTILANDPESKEPSQLDTQQSHETSSLLAKVNTSVINGL